MAQYANGIPLGRVSVIRQTARALDDMGVSPEALMRRLDMPMWHDREPESLFPLRELYRLMESGAPATGSTHFGMEVMARRPLATVGIFGRLVAAAPTVHQALRTWVRIARRCGTAKDWWLMETQDDVWFCRGGGVTFDVGERAMIAYALAGMVQVVQLGAGPGWQPPKVRVQSADTLGLEDTDLFGEAQILPDPSASAIAIPRAVLALPTGAEPADPALEEDLGNAPPTAFAAALRRVVATLLHDGDVRIERAAAAAGLSPRSLQRRMAQRGLSYKDLVRDARLALAEKRLGGPDASVTDIGYELGYSDTAHFTRAFRAWTGVTPSAYRRLHTTATDRAAGTA